MHHAVVHLSVPVVAHVLDPLKVVKALHFVHHHLGDNVATVHVERDERSDDVPYQLAKHASHQGSQLVQFLAHEEEGGEGEEEKEG